MEPQEPLDEFSIRFVHYCFEFPKKDVDWKLLCEQFKYVILVSLEQFQVATQPDPSILYDDPPVASCSDCIPNVSLSISPSPDHILASQESISICDILAPPPELLGSGVVTLKVLGKDRHLQEDKAYYTTFEYFTHPVKSRLEN